LATLNCGTVTNIAPFGR